LTQGKGLPYLYPKPYGKETTMPKVSSKRQITLPIDQCKAAGIEPGDEYDSYVDNEGHITIVKKIAGAARSLLKGIPVDDRYTEEQSRQSGLAR
jgi:bifunctional DNA-binding transcriptional regulator/antitoxin component of YhaV-PrlF toxin-antitoxin module